MGRSVCPNFCDYTRECNEYQNSV